MSDWRPLEGSLAGWSCGDGPRLVFAHGFTQTSNSWKPIAEHFVANGYESVVVDLPGHGASTDGDVDRLPTRVRVHRLERDEQPVHRGA